MKRDLRVPLILDGKHRYHDEIGRIPTYRQFHCPRASPLSEPRYQNPKTSPTTPHNHDNAHLAQQDGFPRRPHRSCQRPPKLRYLRSLLTTCTRVANQDLAIRRIPTPHHHRLPPSRRRHLSQISSEVRRPDSSTCDSPCQSPGTTRGIEALHSIS